MSPVSNTHWELDSKSTLANMSPPSSPPQTDELQKTSQNEPEEEPCPSRILPTPPYTPPASPPPSVSKSISEDKQLAEVETQPTVSQLKSQLGIDNGKCGCVTTKGHPCKNAIPHLRDIDTQLGSLKNASHSSQKIRDELYKLAGLVHCYHHNYSTQMFSRVDKWRNTFALEESIEEEIGRTLRYYPAYCAGTNRKGATCGNPIGGQRVQNRKKTIDEILNRRTYLNDGRLVYFLQVLKENMFCHWHINQGDAKVAIWERKILRIREERKPAFTPPRESNSPETEDSHTSCHYDRVAEKFSSTTITNPDLQNEGLTKQYPSPVPNKDPATYWPQKFDTSPFDIIVTSDKSKDSKSPFSVIHSKLTEPLEQIDQKEGYLYAYEVEGNAGFVKIGYTTRSLATRHGEWAFYCNRKPKVLYPVPANHQMPVPNAHRVEALCHAELKHRNIRIDCHGCSKPHIEWFQVDPEEAIAVIQKWSKWMLTSPYTSESHKTPTNLILKDQERKKAESIEQFMKELSGMIADQPLLK